MDQLRYGLLIFALAAAVPSCQSLFPPSLAITASGPAAGRYEVTKGLEAWVRFSSPLPQAKAEKGIVLREDGTAMRVRYNWAESRVAVVPDKGFSLGHRYDLTVAATVENDSGVDLGTDFALTFYTRADDTRPTVVFSPSAGFLADGPLQPWRLTFSKPVNRASLYSNLSLSPPFKAAFAWDTELSCVVTPLEALKSPSVYTIKLGAATAAADGNTLGTDVSSWFALGTPGPGPVPVRVAGTGSPQLKLSPVSPGGSVTFDAGFERTWGLEVEFDTPVLRSGLESLITVEPAWAFSMPYSSSTVQSVRLVPGSPLAYGTVYTLTLHRGISDAGGNPSTADWVYRFKVDGPGSAPPVLRFLAFHTNLDSPDIDVISGDHSTDYQCLHAEAFDNVGAATFVDLAFTVAAGADIDTASVMKHFSISATDANTAVAMTGVGLPQPLGTAEQTVRVGLHFNRGGSGLIVFKLASGFADTRGNATSADQSWPVLE